MKEMLKVVQNPNLPDFDLPGKIDEILFLLGNFLVDQAPMISLAINAKLQGK